MKKNEIYVVIDSEKRLRAIQILTDAGENIWEDSCLFKENERGYLVCRSDNLWYLVSNRSFGTEITLDQLEQLLSPKQEPMKLDALKLIAESYGVELVEKKREIIVGDFGKFSSENGSVCSYGFLYKIKDIQ
jgi:hypothetical protein